MVKSSRTSLMVAVALLFGVAAGAVGMMSLRGGDGPYAGSPLRATRGMGAGSASTAFVTAVAGNCDMAPVLPKAGNGDGRDLLQNKPGTATPNEVASLILDGKEAAAAGRQRDAEVDFLNACRNAAALQDGDPVPLSDAMYQLARHYANVGALGAAGKGKELFERAERLYSASLEGYRARYGEDSEKTRFAREGLVTVQQATGGKPPTAIAKSAPAPAAPAASEPLATAPASVPAASAASAPDFAALPEPAPMHQDVAKVLPEPPRASASQERRAAAPVRKPRVQEQAQAQRESTPAIAGPAPSFAIPEEPRLRAQVRRAPQRELAPPDEVVIDAPPVRRPRPAIVESAPARPEPPQPPADYSSSGAGGVPAAEGSPSTP